MLGCLRLLGGVRGVAIALISAYLAGSSAWKWQALRYTGQIARLQAQLDTSQAQLNVAKANLRAKLAAYQKQLAVAQARLVQAQAKVVTRTEVRYRDRIKVVQEKGKSIAQAVPIYITQQDNARFGVNLGFVRLYNAAFTGIPASAPTESDREPAGLPLTTLAKTTAFNANVCWQWREQALGWRAFYRGLQEQWAVLSYGPLAKPID